MHMPLQAILAKRRRAILQVALGAILISFSPVFVTLAGVGPTAAAFYRMLFGGGILLLLLLVRRERLRWSWDALGLAAVCGLFFAFDLVLFHQSILYVGPGVSTLLGNFQVFFLAAFGILAYRERPGWRYLLSLPLAILGIVLVVGLDWQGLSPQYQTGVFLSLGGALCYSTYLLLMGRPQSRLGAWSPMANLAVIALVAIPILGVTSLLQGQSLAIPGTRNLLILVGYAIGSQVLGWWLISSGLPFVEASRVGLLLLLQPALAFVWDILFFGRPTTWVEGLGAILAMGAIYLGTTRKAIPSRQGNGAEKGTNEHGLE
jgi:drug/metabolite transporter (DMT)-like permease